MATTRKRDRRKPGTPPNIGRPRKPSARRTPAVEDSLLEWVRAGKSTASWCDDNDWSESTIWRWAAEQDTPESFGQRFARAREAGAIAMAYQCLDIADDRSNDTIVDDEGNERPNTEWIARARLRVDTRMKLAAKFNPTVLGDRQAITGHPDAPPVVSQAPVPANDEVAIAAIMRLLAQGTEQQE